MNENEKELLSIDNFNNISKHKNKNVVKKRKKAVEQSIVIENVKNKINIFKQCINLKWINDKNHLIVINQVNIKV